MGDGTCTIFSREELYKVLGDFDGGTLSTAPGLTSLVEMKLDTGYCLYHTTPILPTRVF